MHRGPRASTAAACFLVCLLGAAVAWPLTASILRGSGAVPTTEGVDWSVDWGLLASSIGIASLIAVLSTALALPAAWASRAVSGRVFVLLLAPMLLPDYLAYTGWSELRGADTVLGRWLMTGPPGTPNIKPMIAGWVCAVGGMALWAWPIAVVVMAVRIRRLDPAVLDALRLEPMSPVRRAISLVWMTRSSVAGAALAVALVMLGSAVPLHVAQLDTYAIRIWRQLDLTPPDQQARVWIAAWPSVLIAGAAGLWMARHATGAERSSEGGGAMATYVARSVSRPGGTGILTLAIWLLSVVVPVAVLAVNIRDSGFFRTFWATCGEAVAASGAVAAAAGALGALVSAAVWSGLGGAGRSWASVVTRAAAVTLIAAGLLPGVLVGIATATAWNATGATSDAAAAASMVLAHTARLGLVGVLVGGWAHRSQPEDERRLAALDGADTLSGWWRASLLGQPGPLLAAGLAVGLLSFHEIESAVMLQPPGWDSFPRQMLQLLHYNRSRDLSEAVVAVVLVGLGGAAVMAAAGGWRRR